MRSVLKFVVAVLLGAVAAAAGCSSEPLPKPAAGAGEAGAAGAPGTEAVGGSGGAETTANTPSYVDVENDPRCPDKDSNWSKQAGKSCDSSNSSACYKVWECHAGDESYVDESLFCFSNKWTWTPDQGPCNASKVKIGADDCPTTDWSQADGLPCPKEGVECASPEPTDCLGGAAYTEYVNCTKRRWRWTTDATDCGEGGTGNSGVTGGASGAAGAPP